MCGVHDSEKINQQSRVVFNCCLLRMVWGFFGEWGVGRRLVCEVGGGGVFCYCVVGLLLGVFLLILFFGGWGVGRRLVCGVSGNYVE